MLWLITVNEITNLLQEHLLFKTVPNSEPSGQHSYSETVGNSRLIPTRRDDEGLAGAHSRRVKSAFGKKNKQKPKFKFGKLY